MHGLFQGLDIGENLLQFLERHIPPADYFGLERKSGMHVMPVSSLSSCRASLEVERVFETKYSIDLSAQPRLSDYVAVQTVFRARCAQLQPWIWTKLRP